MEEEEAGEEGDETSDTPLSWTPEDILKKLREGGRDRGREGGDVSAVLPHATPLPALASPCF